MLVDTYSWRLAVPEKLSGSSAQDLYDTDLAKVRRYLAEFNWR